MKTKETHLQQTSILQRPYENVEHVHSTGAYDFARRIHTNTGQLGRTGTDKGAEIAESEQRNSYQSHGKMEKILI